MAVECSTSGHTRRQFCSQACQLASLAMIGGVLGGCSGNPVGPGTGKGEALPTLGAGLVGGRPTVKIADGSPLASVGKPALVQVGGSAYLVTRKNANTFVALDGQCTHFVCTVTNFDNSIFICPCHGSEFDVSGQVVHGPATKPLREYETEFSNNTLTIVI